MTIPRFTAQRALTPARGRYRGAPRHAASPGGLVAAQTIEIDGVASDDDAMENGSTDDDSESEGVFEFDDGL